MDQLRNCCPVLEDFSLLLQHVAPPFRHQNGPQVPVYSCGHESVNSSVSKKLACATFAEYLHRNAHNCVSCVKEARLWLIGRWEERRRKESQTQGYAECHGRYPCLERALKVRSLVSKPQETSRCGYCNNLAWVAFDLENKRIHLVGRRQGYHKE